MRPSAASMAHPAQVVGGRVLEQPLPRARFLETLPRAAYTAALVRDGRFVREWPLHVQRLSLSLASLHPHLPAPGYSAHLQVRGLSLGGDPRHLCQSPRLSPRRSCVSDGRPPPPADLFSCTQRVAPEAPDGEAALDLLEGSLRGPIGACLSAYRSGAAEVPSLSMLVVALEPPPRESSSAFEVHAHVAPAPARHPRREACLLGAPRAVPVAKDSSWILARRGLEAQRPGDAEVLLSNADGGILEGLTTNFFVVERGAAAVLTLRTAAPSQGVAWGTGRERVLRAARSLGWRVVEDAPLGADANAWVEAFVGNAVDPVQPLERVWCSEDNIWGLGPWARELPGVDGELLAPLRDEVAREMTWTDASMW